MLFSKEISYRRGLWQMARSQNEINEQKRSLKEWLNDLFKHQYIMGVLTSLTATAIISIISSEVEIRSMPDRVTTLEETLSQNYESINENLSTLKQETFKNFENTSSDLTSFKEDMERSFADMNETLSNLEESTAKDIEKVEQDIKNINDKLFNMALNVTPTGSTVNSITQTAHSMKTEDFTLLISLDNSEPVAIDNITYKEYTASQLAEQKLFMPYINEEGQEVFFLGQFNKNNQWDGDCIINIYENDNLVLITEGEYKDGHLLSYKQVLPFTTNAGVNVWSISERTIISKDPSDKTIDYTNEDKYFINGESWNYFADDENAYRKQFSFDEASERNIITVEQFKSTIDSPLEGYYYGNTSNGKYNDDTGLAYMIKYFENGTVRTLYCGNFQNGTFNDSTNNAWLISKNENTTYMYYRGAFENEKPLHNEGFEFENYLTLDRIKELLIENNFYHELNWDQSNNS